MKRNAPAPDALNFEEIALLPLETSIKEGDVSLKTRLTRSIPLDIPVLRMGDALAAARAGGLGIIPATLSLGQQVEEVRRVKRDENRIIMNPITISPESGVVEALDLMTTYKISGIPVIEQPSRRVVGIITARDLRFFTDYSKQVKDLMSRDVVTLSANPDMDMAKQIMHQKRIEKIVLVDNDARCIGLITVKDFEKQAAAPHATRDALGRLRVGAQVGVGKEAVDRAAAMADAGLDVVFVDTPHAHSKEAIHTVSQIRQQRSSDVQVVAGNVCNAEAARSLVDAGADAIKVDVPHAEGSGIGAPVFKSLLDVVEECAVLNVPVIFGGKMTDPALFAKVIATGAEAAVIKGETPAFTHALKEAMAYTGNADIRTFIANAEFTRVK